MSACFLFACLYAVCLFPLCLSVCCQVQTHYMVKLCFPFLEWFDNMPLTMSFGVMMRFLKKNHTRTLILQFINNLRMSSSCFRCVHFPGRSSFGFSLEFLFFKTFLHLNHAFFSARKCWGRVGCGIELTKYMKGIGFWDIQRSLHLRMQGCEKCCQDYWLKEHIKVFISACL